MSRVIKSSRVIEKMNIFSDDNHENQSKMEADTEIILEKAKKKSQEIISEANEKAESIINEANKKSQKLLEIAYQKSKDISEKAKLDGYNEGYEKGYAEGKCDSDDLIKEANDIKSNYLNERRNILGSIEKDVIELVIDICEKILNDKLNDNDTLISLIKNGLDKIDNSDIYSITVSEEDYDVVQMYKDRIVSYSNLVEDIEIKIDSKLIRGDVVVETSKGAIDTSVSTQIEQVKKLLLELLDSE